MDKKDAMKTFPRILIGSLGLGMTCWLLWYFLVLPPTPPQEQAQPDWSPNGQRLTYVCYLEGPTEGWSWYDIIFNFSPPGPDIPWSNYSLDAADICVTDIDGHNHRRLTRQSGREWGPVWSPDGSRIAYLRYDGIYVIDDNSGEHHKVVSGDIDYRTDIIWSSDGEQLLFSACLNHSDHDIYLVEIESGVITNLTPDSPEDDFKPAWTLGGTEIFFLSSSPSVTSSNNCNLRRNDLTHQMKVINKNGGNERIIVMVQSKMQRDNVH